MNILVIEDDKMTMKAVKYALVQKGHKVFLASNEMNALNQLRRYAIDCIVSDINIPGNPKITDVVQRLKHFDNQQRPIILISSVTDNPLIDDSLLTGADAFVPKPLDYDLLVDVVERHAHVAVNK